MSELLKVKITPQQITDILKNSSWKYAGCGYWIDPINKTKHQTNIAFEIESKRVNVLENKSH
jgi:hypothetical protein